jgi:hypothetical protein
LVILQGYGDVESGFVANTGRPGKGGSDKVTKSSTVPKAAAPFDGLHVETVTCGSAHSLFIVRNDTEADQKVLDKLPEFKPDEDEDVLKELND